MLIAAVAIVAYFTVWPWAQLALGISLLPNPSKPEIRYGEFPFRLVYELDGETKAIEDTLICEYDGIGMNEGIGKFRKWKVHFASGNENIGLLKVKDALGIASVAKKTVTQEIYYDLGPAWYYMGDYELENGYKQIFPNASFSEQYQDGSGAYGIIQADELLKNYNIKLISWDSTEPIKNRFSTTRRTAHAER